MDNAAYPPPNMEKQQPPYPTAPGANPPPYPAQPAYGVQPAQYGNAPAQPYPQQVGGCK